MPTTHPRIQVTLDTQLGAELNSLAHASSASLSAIAVQLIREALELREDRALSRYADRRLKQTKKWLSHREVWGDE